MIKFRDFHMPELNSATDLPFAKLQQQNVHLIYFDNVQRGAECMYICTTGKCP